MRRDGGVTKGLVVVSPHVNNRHDTFNPKVSLRIEGVSAREVLTRLGEPFGLEIEVRSFWVVLVGS